MRPSQIDFFGDGTEANGDSGIETLSGNLQAQTFQVYAQDSTTPTYTATLYGRVRKERRSDPSHAPQWVQLAQITNATSVKMVSIGVRADETKVTISGYSGTGKVFAVLSGHNVGSM